MPNVKLNVAVYAVHGVLDLLEKLNVKTASVDYMEEAFPNSVPSYEIEYVHRHVSVV
jgi:hypothetical protein